MKQVEDKNLSSILSQNPQFQYVTTKSIDMKNSKNNFSSMYIFKISKLILHYDNQVKSETNWNEIEPTVKTVIRGLNLSGLCEKGKFLISIQMIRNVLKMR